MTSLPKKHTSSNSANASGLASSQSQPDSLWSAHASRLGESPSPFPRIHYALSTRATDLRELFLFGGCAYIDRSKSLRNDLYMISTWDFSTTLLKTKGDAPNPRFAHCAVFIDAIRTLFIWGGATNLGESDALSQPESNDDSLYMLNLASRDWISIKVNGPVGRYGHTMMSDGSKLFIFGGRNDKKRFNDIWAFDLNCLEWESYEPTTGNKKPLPRSSHVSIITGDCIIIFGGCSGTDNLNDTWSFDISTRKWTELQCNGSIPSPRRSHAAVLIDNVMYVYGGHTGDGTYLGELTALNLSTQRWTTFQDIGIGPRGRAAHAMASDGRRIFVFGGLISPGRWVYEVNPIHVINTELLGLPKPDSNTVTYDEKTIGTIQLARKLPTIPLHLKRQRSRSTGASSRPSRVSNQNDDGEGSTETQRHAILVTLDTPPGKELAESEDGRLVELERRLSETLVVKNEQDRRIAQLTNELALKSALLEQAEANAAEEEKRAGQELRDMQAKLDESLMSRNHALEQAQSALQKTSRAAEAIENLHANAAEEKKRAGRELRELQAKLDESLMSRDHALEQAQSALQKASRVAEANENLHTNAAEEKKRAGRELRELQAKLDESLLSRDHALEQAQSALQKESRAVEANENLHANAAEEKRRAGRELRELQAKLDESLLSRDHALEANERSQLKLAEVYAKLEARESELAAVRLRLTDTGSGCAKSKAEAASNRNVNENAPGLVNADEDPDRVIHRLMERVRALEAEMAIKGWNEKSFEMMEWSNED